MRVGNPIPEFWTAILSDQAFQDLSRDNLIQDVHVNRIVAEPFTDVNNIATNATIYSPYTYATQLAAPPELCAISQPRHAQDDDITQYPNYVYRSGKILSKSYIYHAELGIDPYYLDFHKLPIEWIFTGRAIHNGLNTRREAPNAKGHSTCTASKAAGKIYGASRLGTLVVVKMPGYDEASTGGILGTIYDHIKANHRQSTSVVSVSWGSRDPVSPPWPGVWNIIWNHAQLISDELHVPIVVAAGNAALRYDRHEKAAPLVAGVIADFISVGLDGRILRQSLGWSQFLSLFASQRRSSGPFGELVIWNMVQSRNNPPSRRASVVMPYNSTNIFDNETGTA
ncbi:MAG: hypothetical protein Q9213_006084 [Squamulea squamosa]